MMSVQIEPFRFTLTEQCRRDLNSLKNELEDLQEQFEALDDAKAQLFNPFYECFLRMISKLGDNLVLVEGYGNIEATGAKKR